MPIGGNRAQRRLLIGLSRMQKNAVQVVARLFRRNGKPRLVDDALQFRRRNLERMPEIARCNIRKILRPERLQGEPGLSRRERQPLFLRVALQFDLRPVGQLAHDVVQHVRGNRQRTRLRHVGLGLLDDLALEVRRLELQPSRRRLQQHVRQDRDRRAPFHDTRDMPERSRQFAFFDNQTHVLLALSLAAVGTRTNVVGRDRRPKATASATPCKPPHIAGRDRPEQ